MTRCFLRIIILLIVFISICMTSTAQLQAFCITSGTTKICAEGNLPICFSSTNTCYEISNDVNCDSFVVESDKVTFFNLDKPVVFSITKNTILKDCTGETSCSLSTPFHNEIIEFRLKRDTTPPCSFLGGICLESPCDNYQDCSSLNGYCDSGYCCSGECLSNCADLGGVCKSDVCSNYNDCSSLNGYCSSGHCCSGSCTASSEGGGGGGGGGGGASIDRTPPTISEVQIKEITTSTALIYWKTNERATSKVSYGTSSKEYNFSTSSSSLVLEHQILLQNLLPVTRYYFVAISKDSLGNQETSEEFNFQTLSITQQESLGKIEIIVSQDSFEGNSLEKATLTLLPLNYRCITDKEGKCVFENIPSGIYSIKGEKEGYVSCTKENIEIKKDQTTQVKIYLKKESETKPKPSEKKKVVITVIFTQNLYPGQRSQQVKKLQELLATDKEIYPEGFITGYYGSLTTKAVQRFQCKYNIVCFGSPQTTGWGSVGPKTRKKLNEVFGKKETVDKDRQALIELIKEQIKYLQKLVAQLLARLNKLLQERKLKLER